MLLSLGTYKVHWKAFRFMDGIGVDAFHTRQVKKIMLQLPGYCHGYTVVYMMLQQM
jgi:hypothetical protein